MNKTSSEAAFGFADVPLNTPANAPAYPPAMAPNSVMASAVSATAEQQPTSLSLKGGAGIIDCVLDWPGADAGPLQGWMLVLHPHPLYGGTRDNKVVTTITRAALQQGWMTLRPSFRGVGLSAGEHDNGEGETQDMLALVSQVYAQFPVLSQLNFALSGFSFGAAVAANLRPLLVAQGRQIQHLILVGTAVVRFPVAEVPEDTLIIHGELDETIPLKDLLDWARPQSLAIMLVPGADHFFHRKLALLKQWISRALHVPARLTT